MSDKLKYPLKVGTLKKVEYAIQSQGQEFYTVYDKSSLTDIVARANALSDVENPEAVRELLDWLIMDKDVSLVEYFDCVNRLVSKIKFTEDGNE